MNLPDLNSLSQTEFTHRLGGIFEDSPWVAERAWSHRPFASVDALHAAMAAEVERATPEEQLALLRAHPDLGARVRMSAASVSEQSGAGLDQLKAEEYEELTRLNQTYRETFGFPFLFAVKGTTRHDILKALRRRVAAAREEEFRTALDQVFRIARFRLEE
ncbi:MAG TPA: 2-oxo-4-hydroxy-4-carboxy-5-ureidoimidazoline decarboxylase [Verrucomicrobiae bacterium]|nr:2-oxo-4-hydroxy-4-carboxy-5-ureidoimidazoline decarboxylase [Verrucomicrobiae bacterium]